MLYGYLPAVITGFLLTAVPNWTGRLPLQGRPLLVLVLVWAAGRVAVTMSAWIGWLPAAVIDIAFLLLVAAAMAPRDHHGQELAQPEGSDRRCAFSSSATSSSTSRRTFIGAADYGVRLGIGATILLIMLIGGRIVPSFTRNWLARENPGRLPASFGALRHGLDGLRRQRAPGVGRVRRTGRHRGCPDRRGRCSRRCVWRAGPASALGGTGSSSSCTSPTPSCRSASF